MYNIPDGATFWVPLQAAYYGKGGSGGGGVPPTTQKEATETKKKDGSDTPLGDVSLPEGYKEWWQYEQEFGNAEKDAAAKKSIQAVKPEETKVPGVDDEGKLKKVELSDDKKTYERYEKNYYLNDDAEDEDSEPSRTRKSRSVWDKLTEGLENFDLGDISTKIADAIKNVFMDPASPLNPTSPSSTQGSSMDTAPVAKVNLNLSSTTTLQVDGRVLATVIKTYLAQDMARTQASYGSSTSNYVV